MHFVTMTLYAFFRKYSAGCAVAGLARELLLSVLALAVGFALMPCSFSMPVPAPRRDEERRRASVPEHLRRAAGRLSGFLDRSVGALRAYLLFRALGLGGAASARSPTAAASLLSGPGPCFVERDANFSLGPNGP